MRVAEEKLEDQIRQFKAKVTTLSKVKVPKNQVQYVTGTKKRAPVTGTKPPITFVLPSSEAEKHYVEEVTKRFLAKGSE